MYAGGDAYCTYMEKGRKCVHVLRNAECAEEVGECILQPHYLWGLCCPEEEILVNFLFLLVPLLEGVEGLDDVIFDKSNTRLLALHVCIHSPDNVREFRCKTAVGYAWDREGKGERLTTPLQELRNNNLQWVQSFSLLAAQMCHYSPVIQHLACAFIIH